MVGLSWLLKKLPLALSRFFKRGYWLKYGVMLEKPDGKKSMKVDALPVGPGRDGWLVRGRRDRKSRKIGLKIGTELIFLPF
jgi:hypothetical protein